ncbi:hypothetical protein L6164_001333 [Bauhinia variegata]|uniref:Uncharacterized protein n=1 Tax=Bauhinia variegata TaxID=167791 RepID=A0ACB9Q9C1_BAUVA|nr:hypothetical protein L6164_001333 [Bauhinia variegata]
MPEKEGSMFLVLMQATYFFIVQRIGSFSLWWTSFLAASSPSEPMVSCEQGIFCYLKAGVTRPRQKDTQL